ncbi:ADP,ATP carrier protein ER-ANT1 [Tanacetum coccineum]
METKSERFSSDFLLGGVAAIISKSAAAPLDRVKLLLQNQGELLKRGQLTVPYTGVGNCFKRIFKEEGFFSFWRGNQVNVIRYFPTQAFNFAFKGYYKSVFGRSKEKDGNVKWFVGNRCSGSAAGSQTSIVSTLASDGIRGLYRGFGVSIVGITLYRGMYFGLYDTMKPIVLIGSLQDNFVASFFLGWSVTTFSGFCAYPFDTLRRRMMLTSGQPIKYRHAIHALSEIIRLEGFWALYRGVTANMLVGVAGAGVLSGKIDQMGSSFWYFKVTDGSPGNDLAAGGGIIRDYKGFALVAFYDATTLYGLGYI